MGKRIGSLDDAAFDALFTSFEVPSHETVVLVPRSLLVAYAKEGG